MTCRLLLALALLFWPAFANAGDGGVVRGKITDRVTGLSLPGVYVVHGKHQGVISGSDGSYVIVAEAGKLILTFRFIGYETITRDVTVLSNDTVTLDIEMDTKIREIDQIVVSASRSEQKVAELTISLDVIKSGFISQNHITDAQEIINKTSGIEVIDGQASVRGGSGYSYGVGSRVLALIDGLPVLSADAGNIKWQFLPLENIAQIEIIKGASSVLYGSSALNGVINFRSAEPSTTPTTTFYAETGVFDNPANKNWKWWTSPRFFSSASFSHLRKEGNTDVGIGLNLLSEPGYRKLNDEKLGRISLRLKHTNSRIRELSYGINMNAGYTGKSDFVLWEDGYTGALKQDESTALNLHGSFIALDPFLSYRQGSKTKHDLRMRLQSTINRFPDSKKNNSRALSLYSEYQLVHKFSEKISLTAGASGNVSSVVSEFYGDHDALNIAGYSQLEIKPAKRLKAVAGLRIEENFVDGTNDRIVPIFRAGINYQAADYTYLRASFGQGYRFPSIAEQFASTTLGSVRIFPNPGIGPESGWSSEIGVKQGIAKGKIAGHADISFFLTQNSDLIEYIFSVYTDPDTGSPDYGFKATNVEQSRIYGGELEFSLTRTDGKIKSSLTGGYTFVYPVEYNKNTNQNKDTFLKYRRKHSAKLIAGITSGKFECGAGIYAKSKILNIDDVFVNPLTRESILPGFYDYWIGHNTGFITVDVNAGIKINDSLSLSFIVKNLTNTEYMGRPGDIQPHRNYSIRLTGSF